MGDVMKKRVLNGIDVLDIEKLKASNIALVINYSSVNQKGEHLLDILMRSAIKVVRIFTPEHGLFLNADGQKIEDFIHPRYRIPVTSIYGSRFTLDCDLLHDVDVVIYDIQDVGLRYYTFIYALAEVVKACAKCRKKLVVLDRFNPLGRRFFGPRIPQTLNSIVGAYELPVRYGLSTGELALYYKKFFGLDVEIDIIKCVGWSGEDFSKIDTFWNVPSPNLPTFSSLLCYAGLCLFEATNLSVGRGTTKPFEFIGAPWLDEDEMYTYLKGKFPNMLFRKRQFIPQFREYAYQVCNGLEFVPSPEDNFFEVAVAILEYLQGYEQFEVNNKRIDMLAGVENFMESKDQLLNFNLNDYFEFISDVLLYKNED